MVATLAACATTPPPCAPVGRWVSPATLRVVPDPVPAAAAGSVILLGETHDSAADHRWQLETIGRLHAVRPGMVLGFEMFPRAVQPVLDRWVAGGLDERAFLAQTDWAHVWGFDPALYLPLFRFARDHRIPMLALNVSHRVVHLTSASGWAGVAVADREGVGTPAPAGEAYRAMLSDAMSGHGGPAMTPERLQHFIDAQLLWDRAMAEAIVFRRVGRDRLVVALMGAGHLEHRDGVPHQLESLGVGDAIVWLPGREVCEREGRDYADAVFVDGPGRPAD